MPACQQIPRSSRLRRLERRLLHKPYQYLPIRQPREVHHQVRAVEIRLHHDLIPQEELLTLEQADLRVWVLDVRQVILRLGVPVMIIVGALDCPELGQEIQRLTDFAIVLKTQVMGGFHDSVRDQHLRLQGVALDHLEEVGHALRAVQARDGQGGASGDRLAESRDDFDHLGLVAGPVFDRQFTPGAFRPVADDDVAVLVQAADAGILVPFPVEERCIEERGRLDQLLELALYGVGREVGRVGAQDEFGRWQCWVVHKGEERGRGRGRGGGR